jgi:hypothetical protein
MVTNGEMLKVLQKTKFPKNTGRKNILKGKQEYSRSLVVGKVKMMYGRGCADSRHNKNFKELHDTTRKFSKTAHPNYRFQAVTINKNHAAAKHVDKNNKGYSYIIGLGNYTGGELVFTNPKSPHYGSHNIKNKWLKFRGNTEHYVKPFKGERYTIVYYNIDNCKVTNPKYKK